MKIVLLESLGVSDEVLAQHTAPLLAQGHSFQAFDRDMDPAVQIQRAKDADVIMIANMPLTAEVIRACDHLKFIDVAFTGVDHVALDAAKEKGVRVSNAAGYSNEAVAELVLGMMLALLRNVPQVERRCRAGQTKDGLVGRELRGKTVGVVGVGAIGRRVAELCHAFGCRVLGYRRHPEQREGDYVQFVSLDELLAQSDIVTLHCPLNEQSRHLIDATRLSQMKKGALLINAARGPVVDSAALAAALHSGHLGGAGIDVFETEPPLSVDHPLLGCPNTIVTPHVAFASEESMIARCEIVFDSLQKWMDGKQINVIL